MPEYRSSNPPAASRFGAVSKFLNLKRVFDDAVRQERWKREQSFADQISERSRSAATLATNSGMSGPELNQYIQQGTFPETYKGSDPFSMPEIPAGMEIVGYSVKGQPMIRKLPKLTDAESKTLSNTETLANQIKDLRSIIEEDSRQGLIGGLLTKAQSPVGVVTAQGQRYRLIRGDVADRLLRLRSGAQINESEFRRLNSLLPKIFRRDAVDLEQLDKFEQEFSKIQERIIGGRVGIAKEAAKEQDDFSKMSDEELKKIIQGAQ